MIIKQTGVTPSVSRLWVSVRSGHCRYGVKTNQRSDKFGEPSTPVSRRGNRFEYFAAAVELNRRSRNTKHTNANLSNSNPPRVVQSLRAAFGWSSLLTLLPGRSTQVSLWSLSGMRGTAAAKPKHRWCACQRAPATPAGTGISEASSNLPRQYLVPNVHLIQKSMTPPKETSKRNFLRGLRDTIDHLGL